MPAGCSEGRIFGLLEQTVVIQSYLARSTERDDHHPMETSQRSPRI